MLRSFWRGRVISDTDLKPFGDLSGLEAFINHLHFPGFRKSPPEPLWPPVISMRPSVSSVAVALLRAMVIDPVGSMVLVVG